jgi:hypothetical protein
LTCDCFVIHFGAVEAHQVCWEDHDRAIKASHIAQKREKGVLAPLSCHHFVGKLDNHLKFWKKS